MADPVRITLPKGGYAPIFESAAAAPASRSRRGMWLSVAALTVAAAVITFGSRLTPDVVSLVVIPASGEQDHEFADGLAEAVSAELSRNARVQVVAWPLFVEYRQQHGDVARRPTSQVARDLRTEAVLYLSVRRSGERQRIIAHLMNPEQGWKRWAGEYERAVADGFAVQRETARAISDEVLAGLAHK